MPPAVNQEINVNINALVKRIQDVKDLVATIKSLRGASGPVVIDEKISKNAKASAGDVTQLKTSIENLTAAIDKMDEHKVGRLGRLLTVLGGVATILGHIKSGHEGIKVLQELTGAAPNLSNKLSGAGAAISNFFGLARDKISGAASAVKTKVASIVEDLPGLARGLAGGTAGLLGIAGAATVAGVALFAVVGIVAALVAAFVALPLVGGFLLKLASSAAETGAKFHDLSQQTGASVELLSTLAPVLEDSNGSLEQMAKGLGKFNKLIGEAASGRSKEATADLKLFGLTAKQALADSDAALEKVFKRIIALPPGIQQAIAAQKAFGKAGAELVPTIIATGGNIEELKKKAIALGVYWTTDGAAAADEYGDRLAELQRTVEGLSQSVGRVLIPELLKLLRIFTNDAPQAGGIFQVVLDAIARAARNTTNEIILLIAAAKTLKDVPGAIAASIATGSVGVGAGVLSESFQQNLAALLQVANTPGGGNVKGTQDLDLAGTKKGKTARKPEDTFDSDLDFRRAAAQHTFDLESDLLDRLTDIYKTAFDDRKIATEDFFEFTQDFRRRTLEAELKLQKELQRIEEDRLAAEQKTIREDKKTTPAQKAALDTNAQNKFFSTTTPIATRIEQLTRELGDLPRLAEQAERAALTSLDEQITEFLARVDEANGRTAHAAAEAIDREFKELLERVTIEQGKDSPLVKLIQEFIQVQKDRARVAQIDQRLVPLGQQFDIDRLNVETQVSRHVITQREARRQINALQKKYLEAQLEILKLELETTTEAKTQLEIKLKIANVENALANLKEIDRTAASINDSLRGSLEDFFGSLADGTKTLKQAFADLGSFILQMFARLAAAKLVQSIFGNLLGDEQGQGGLGGILSGLFGGKKAAGDLMSARPGGQLIQVAEAGFDELVVSTDPRYAVRTSALLGKFIERTGIVPNLARFAAGGFARSVADSFLTIPRLAAGAFIPAAPAFAGGAAAGGDRYLHIKQVNVYDPAHVHDAMRSEGGEQVFWNFVDRNATAIRRRLKI
jgi:hypothetical protein